MRRTLTITACVATALALAAGPATAGEWNANGQRTGAYENGKASICHFSGLDEGFVRDVEDDPDPFTHTQNYGQIVRQLGQAAAKAMVGTPADSCNPNAGGGGH